MARQLCEEKSSTGFCYSDVSPGNPTMLVNQIQGFVSEPEMYNLSTGMEMIGFPKSDTNAVMWRSFIPKPGPSSSKTINDSSTPFYHHDYNNSKPSDFTPGNISEASAENLMVGAHDSAPWQDDNSHSRFDDSSLRCVFPCEANERPSQGLSLSLSSTNPSTIGLQSFELRQTSHHPDFVPSSSREGFFGKPVSVQQQQMLQDGYVSSNSKAASVYQQGHFLVKNSKYLVPAQDLLNEFCSLDAKQSEAGKPKSLKKQWEEENNCSGSLKKPSLTSLEFVELQKRKTKLLSMLEEVYMFDVCVPNLVWLHLRVWCSSTTFLQGNNTPFSMVPQNMEKGV